jgi:pyridoxamine 5'-phosphate oxidase
MNARPELVESQLSRNPFEEFAKWYEEAQRSNLPEPTAMSLATADSNGRPTSRMVLLKGFDESGFVFYTNYNSRKGKQLEVNRYAALLFWWPTLNRQIRIEGSVARVTAAESDTYFASRPLGSQVGAIVSPQSDPINRETLHKRFRDALKESEGQSVTRPAHWGGYRLMPDLFEFWQSGANRLHDRFEYRVQVDGRWQVSRLAP